MDWRCVRGNRKKRKKETIKNKKTTNKTNFRNRNSCAKCQPNGVKQET